LARVHFYLGIQRCELALVQVEVGRREVTQVEGAGAVACELVRTGTADADE
jgi:hypothetical protein